MRAAEKREEVRQRSRDSETFGLKIYDLMDFSNSKLKIAVLKPGSKLKGFSVYINNHVTKKNAD